MLTKSALTLALLALCGGGVLAGYFSVSTAPEATGPQRIGPPVYYHQDMMRYSAPDPETTPIPQPPVTREDYYQWLVDSGHFAYAKDNPLNHKLYGPRHYLPLLAKYVHDKDPAAGQACLAMLKVFYQALQQEVNARGWDEQFTDEPSYLGLYRRYLTAGGLLDEKRDTWFRDMVLYLNRNMRVWGGQENFWRGPMHRAQGEAMAKRLAVLWYPDIPEAAVWQKYADECYNDFWLFRDNPANDANYYMMCVMPPLLLGAELTGNKQFFTDPDMRKIWDRFMYEVSPDGENIPFGAHDGWNQAAASRILALELAAKYTGDGRYRFAAGRAFNYLRYEQDRYQLHHMLMGPYSTEKLAAVYLLCDDSIKPVQPNGGSQILYHKEMLRIHGKEAAAKYFAQFGQAPLDPNKLLNNIDCGMINTPKVEPFKLILRSGWNPGDFFAEIELYPRHDPLNPPGILGMTRWGACLGMPINAKGSSDENRLLIDDLSGSAPLRFNTNPDLMDKFYQEVTLPEFTDQKAATFVTVQVTNYQGFPVTYTREFLFLKNRFLVTRDMPTFEAGFLASVAPIYNTQNVGPQVGDNWANTFFNAPRAAQMDLKNPPVDLLVWFAPQPGCRLQVVDRTAADVRAADVPVQVRYAWRGLTQTGQRLLFTQLFYPHKASVQRVLSNAPGAARPEDLVGSAGAEGIQALVDTPELTVLRCAFDPGRVEWVVSNPAGAPVQQGALATDARYLYVDTRGGHVESVSAVGATFASLEGQDIFRQAQRGNYEK